MNANEKGEFDVNALVQKHYTDASELIRGTEDLSKFVCTKVLFVNFYFSSIYRKHVLSVSPL